MKGRNPATTHVGTAVPGGPGKRNPISSTIRFSVENLKSCTRIFFAALREIFDESAYARFLTQRQLVSSRAAYAAFRQEHEGAKARRPRCC